MDTAWIEVFVLTISECLAPAGKTICQEQELQIHFVNQADCELAREQFVSLKERSDDVIINVEKTRCAVTAQKLEIFATQDEIRQHAGANWVVPNSNEPAPLDFTQQAHQKRLDELSECEDTGGKTPCKTGTIIMEGATKQSAEVWQKQ